MRIIEADYLLGEDGVELIADGAVVIDGDVIRAVGRAVEMQAHFPDARRERFTNALLLPGFVNSHQHGRGLSQIQLGYPDDALEPWIARRRGRGSLDSYALTRLACEEMLANGVTSTLHANYSYATGNYEAELRGAIRAYEESGLRATICVGYADRGGLIYPPADEFTLHKRLSQDARDLLAASKPAYLPLAETLDLMARLHAEYSGHPTISLAYGPAGPQWVSDEAWRTLARDAAGRGLGIHFHLLESPAQARCARELYREGVLVRLEALGVFRTSASAAHFTQAAERDVEEAKRLGLVVVANPGSNMRLCNGAPDLSSWKEAGLAVAMGTDNCSLQDDEDYLSELRLASALSRSGRHDHQGLDAAGILAMGTSMGARAIFRHDIGRLKVAMKADIIAVDLSRLAGSYLDSDTAILDAVVARAKGEDVLLTIVHGIERYRRGKNELRHEAAVRAGAMARSVRSIGEAASGASEEIADALRNHYREGDA
jgi:cytosine/adenosine deaminase-related metal-dependent hydrolase